jgi:very-short-patch-repair endonuclease
LRANGTDSERRLWSKLRRRQLDGFRFRRQAPIGPFIVDFVCLERHIVIELDGGQHAEQEAADTKRMQWLEQEGYRVIRFWNDDVLKNSGGVVAEILELLRDGR